MPHQATFARSNDAAEPLIVGVVVASDDAAAGHAAALLAVGGAVGAVDGEVPQRGELGLDAV